MTAPDPDPFEPVDVPQDLQDWNLMVPVGREFLRLAVGWTRHTRHSMA